MRLDATNDPAVRDFEQWVRGELYGTNPKNAEPPNLEEIETPTPCPCGRLARLLVENGSAQVVCVNCFRRGPIAQTKWLAIKLWNNDHNGTST